MSGTPFESWEAASYPEAECDTVTDRPGSQRWVGGVAMLASASLSLGAMWWLGSMVAGLLAG